MHDNIGVTRSHFTFSKSTVIIFDFHGKYSPLFAGIRDVRTTTRPMGERCNTISSSLIGVYHAVSDRPVSGTVFFSFSFFFFFLHTITPRTRTVLTVEDDICTISIILNVYRYALSAVTTAAQLLFFEIIKK